MSEKESTAKHAVEVGESILGGPLFGAEAVASRRRGPRAPRPPPAREVGRAAPFSLKAKSRSPPTKAPTP